MPQRDFLSLSEEIYLNEARSSLKCICSLLVPAGSSSYDDEAVPPWRIVNSQDLAYLLGLVLEKLNQIHKEDNKAGRAESSAVTEILHS